MEIATGAMSTVLPKLASLLMEEYKLQKRVRGEIMFLRAELESMETALLAVSEAPLDHPPNRQTKLWARDVRELSYDLEDSIDRFMVHIHSGKPPDKPHSFMGFIDRSLNLLTKAKVRHKIGTEIKDIKSRIKEVSERHDRYKIDLVGARPSAPSVDHLRLSAMYKTAGELIGTEKKSNELITMLMEDDHQVSMQKQKKVSIVGFGGLGKTTLAKLVYDRLKVRFQYKAFVSVSQSPNMIVIFSNMLHQFDANNKSQPTWGVAQFIDEIRKILLNKRYCIVIDDIWSCDVWETIQFGLIENECGSTIITTTRILDVARQVGGVYQLKPLSLDDSRKLFYLRVFGMADKFPPNHLLEVSKNILRKCGGVPLAIITIASMLADKKTLQNTYKYWSEVCQSMGCGMDDSPDVMKMRAILSVSYYDLPPRLKTCLLYLSLYPEDREIDKEYLVWKCIGEGFVCKYPGKTLYHEGAGYANELINRSLIEPVTEVAVRCHDMVLDLITYLSREDNFLLACGQQPVYIPDKVRRLSLQTSTKENIEKLSTMSMSHVRSLTVFSRAFNMLPAISSFPVLRVLDLRDCKEVDNKYCKDICNLLHLRYLSLRSTSITEIPKEIRNLQFLQVLDISSNEIRKLPATFIHLQQLVYLNVPCRTKLPDGFGNLKSLQELPQQIIIRSTIMLHDLCRLTELRALYVRFTEWNDKYLKPLLQYMSNLVFLESLKIRFSGIADLSNLQPSGFQQLRIFDLSARCCVPSVPRWMSSLNSLSCVTIKLLRLGEEDLQVLGSIPCLSDLSLLVRQPRQDSGMNLLVIGAFTRFACLTKFTIFSKTMTLVFAPGAMPKLKTLCFGFGLWETMKQFGWFEFGLENLYSLVCVSIEMGVYNTKPEEVEAAEVAICKALDRNPNKPRPSWSKPEWYYDSDS